jgi:hypothetical protein
MIIKFIWASIMFLLTAGVLFYASYGIDVKTVYYDKSENIVARRAETTPPR